ncbi:MAG TPA: contractile injection system tape measure protein, partial [Algoriphagus sp.]|nr:contractile injection system tape measure protein [Algoriphagus sp.]
LRNNFLLLDLEGWFSLLVSHAFSRFGAKTAISQSLVDLGSKSGISNSSLLLIKVKNRGKEKENLERGSDPVNSSSPVDHPQPGKSISGRFHELVLFEYLNSGTLGTSFRSMGKNDLQWLVAGMIKAFNPNLYHLIRNSTSPNDADLKKRILGLLGKLNRGEVVDYITRFGGSQSLKLLRFNEKLIGVLNPGVTFIQHLDQVVWSVFIREAKAEKNIGREGKSGFAFVASESYFLALRQINITVPSGKMLIDALQKNRNAEKLLLLFFAQNQGLSQSDRSRLGSILSATYLSSGIGLLKWNRVNAKEIFQSQGINKLFRRIDFTGSEGHLLLLAKAGAYSLSSLLFSGNLSQKELEQEALLILKRDFALLIKYSFSKSSVRIKNQELSAVSQRIFLFFQSNPEGLERFLHRHKRRIPLILYSLHQNMKGGDWKKLYPWLNLRFPDELGIFNQMSDPKFGSVWDNLSAWMGKSGQGNHLPLDWNQILHLSNGLGLENSRLSAELGRVLDPDLADEVKFLLELPEGAFYRKSVSVIWRKSVLQIAFQFNRGRDLGKSDSQKSFWRIMLAFINDRRSAFGPESIDWNYLFNSGRLKSESKALLLRFFKSNYLKSNSRVQDSTRQERIASAMVHLNEERFLPWWSPVKSKSGLLFSLITIIDHSKKEDGLLLVSLLSQPKASGLLAGINQEKLLQLLKRLSSSSYKRHFDSLIREINSRLEGSNLPKSKTGPESERKTFSSVNAAAEFKDKPQGELEHWIKKKLNASRETEILMHWFENDPRIKNQIVELLGWGRYMFFGNLNPGKWKFWLLGFGYDFYLRKGNSYSASFLNQFLVHLSKSQGLVNWKGVFHHLLKNKEFFSGLNVASREQILSRFPRDQERKSGEMNSGDQVRITNAGLILCWPFLSVLFSRLKLSSGGVIPVESQARAVFLLQYLAYGHCDFPEYELVLNKVLVGMKSSQHLEKTELSPEEMEMAESLLKGMKSNWEKMKNATVDAIRETFLQREGVLEFGSASNVLRIQKTGVDVLLDSVSWNIAVVRLPWMEKSLEVKWR